MRKSTTILGLCIFLLLIGCTKETIVEGEPNPPISEVPAIELLSVNTTTVKQFTDSLVFTISYIDGDGDLGTTDADARPIEVIDNRDNLIFGFHLPPLAPSGSEITIQGTLDIVLKNIILLDPNNSNETTTFSITIQDRNSNFSNTVTTQTINITQ